MIPRLLALPERYPGATIALIGCLFAGAYTASLILRPKPNGRVISGDALHHYVQLRSVVFDGDLHFRNEYVRFYDLKGGEPGSEWIYDGTETGYVRNLMPVGPAILWAPLFLLVTAGAWIGQLAGAAYPLDGYGRVFQATAGISGVIAATVGAWFSYLAASKLYPRRAAIWSLLTFWLASSAIYYSVISPTYSHAASMLATSAFWFAWIAVPPGTSRYAVLGALTGVAALMRWQDAILLIPIALDAAFAVRTGRQTVGAMVGSLCLAGAAAALVFSPQMIVWMTIYGQPLALPQGPDFMRWTEPALVDVLFSGLRGLFSWTPVALPAAAGVLLLYRRNAPLAAGAAVFLVISWYVNAAVADWWAGEAFGARRFLSCFPVFVLGLTAIVERWHLSLRKLVTASALLTAYTFLLLVQYQAFMHGMRDAAPYPRGGFSLYGARFVVPVRLLQDALE